MMYAPGQRAALVRLEVETVASVGLALLLRPQLGRSGAARRRLSAATATATAANTCCWRWQRVLGAVGRRRVHGERSCARKQNLLKDQQQGLLKEFTAGMLLYVDCGERIIPFESLCCGVEAEFSRFCTH